MMIYRSMFYKIINMSPSPLILDMLNLIHQSEVIWIFMNEPWNRLRQMFKKIFILFIVLTSIFFNVPLASTDGVNEEKKGDLLLLYTGYGDSAKLVDLSFLFGH